MNLRPGDVLLYTAPAIKFSNIVPRLIRLVIGNKSEHVALYIGSTPDGNKHFILDALFSGIEIKDMRTAELKTRTDDFVLHGVVRLKDHSININDIAEVVLKYDKRKYGILTIFNLLFQHLMGRLFNTEYKVWFKSKDKYICSEVCQLVIEEVLKKNNIESPFTKQACLVEPDDYTKDPWVQQDVRF